MQYLLVKYIKILGLYGSRSVIYLKMFKYIPESAI